MPIQTVLLVGFGGFVGTLLRYFSALLIAHYFSVSGLATTIINILGSFLIGVVYGLGVERISPQMLTVLMVGVLGGFTTFSAFSLESVQFLRDGYFLKASVYMACMLLGCLTATYLGLTVAKWL